MCWRWIRFSIVLGVLTLGASAWADGYGEVHVKGPRRVRIFLDDEYMGVTTKEQGGLILTRILAGEHVLRATRTAFDPQEARITVKAGETLVHRLRPFALPGQEPPPDVPTPETPEPESPPTHKPPRESRPLPLPTPEPLSELEPEPPPTSEPLPDPGPEPLPAGSGLALKDDGGAFSHRILAEHPKSGTQKRFRVVLDNALRWLAAHQSPNGCWEAAGFNTWCDGKPIEEEKKRADGLGSALYDSGVTGLALCAFLGAGYVHRGDHPYAKTVERGLRYLKAVQRDSGCFGPQSENRHTYCHATCALAMVEAYGMTGSPWFADSAQRALDYIQKARNPYFAWRYGIKPGDNDTSATGWMIAVLKSAEIVNAHVVQRGMDAPFEIDEGAFEGARAWLRKITDTETGRAGYVTKGSLTVRDRTSISRFPSKYSESMTAVGTLTRLALGESPNSKQVRLGVQLCEARPPEWNREQGTIDMYYWYFGTQLMYQVGGLAWNRWLKGLSKAVVRTQRKDGDYVTCKGSWDPLGAWGLHGGRVYSTALMAMCLVVHTRYARYFAKR